MAGFHAKIDTISIDFPKFTKAMETDCKKLIRLAAQKWLITVLGRIPIRTGFLAGAFTPLEDLVGVVQRNAATGKSLGYIKPNRNPLLSREKKLDFYKKTLAKLEQSIVKSEKSLKRLKQGTIAVKNAAKSDKLEGGVFVSSFKSMNANEKQVIIELRRQQRARMRTIQVEDQITRVKKRISRLESQSRHAKTNKILSARIDAETEGLPRRDASGRKIISKLTEHPVAGGSKAHVMRALERARKLLAKSMKLKERIYNPVKLEPGEDKVVRSSGTYTFKNSKGQIVTKHKGDIYHHAYVREHDRIKRLVEVEQKTEQKIMRAADRIRAKKLAKDGISTKAMKEIEERVFTGKYYEKKRLIKLAKELHMYKEYYKHIDGTKVLKTPRSGVQFATPAKGIFNEFSGEDRSKYEEKIGLIQRMQAAVEGFNKFRDKFNSTSNMESTINGIINKGSENIDLGGRYGSTHSTSPNLATGGVPVVGSSPADEMKKTYDEIMRKTRTDKMFFSFTFNVRITYLGVNEIKFGWHALMLGNTAFLQYLREAVNSKTQFRALTNLQEFLVRRRVTFDGTVGAAETVKRVMRGLDA